MKGEPTPARSTAVCAGVSVGGEASGTRSAALDGGATAFVGAASSAMCAVSAKIAAIFSTSPVIARCLGEALTAENRSLRSFHVAPH